MNMSLEGVGTEPGSAHHEYHEGYGEMNDQVLKLYEASKALLNYIDSEDVFDKVGSMGCGGVDHHQSEAFYDLIAAARIALKEFEKNMKP
jgi:hypothetical protein